MHVRTFSNFIYSLTAGIIGFSQRILQKKHKHIRTYTYTDDVKKKSKLSLKFLRSRIWRKQHWTPTYEVHICLDVVCCVHDTHVTYKKNFPWVASSGTASWNINPGRADRVGPVEYTARCIQSSKLQTL